nr:MAG TPA: hypothetical protein [Caudoviricetes sp.]
MLSKNASGAKPRNFTIIPYFKDFVKCFCKTKCTNFFPKFWLNCLLI